MLSVNYRGSTGFGKAFVAASEKQHAAKMHDDLIDMVEWAIREGIARLNEIVVTGLRERAISQTLDAQGIVPRIMTAAQYREFVAAETEKFGKIVAQANIKVEN